MCIERGDRERTNTNVSTNFSVKVLAHGQCQLVSYLVRCTFSIKQQSNTNRRSQNKYESQHSNAFPIAARLTTLLPTTTCVKRQLLALSFRFAHALLVSGAGRVESCTKNSADSHSSNGSRQSQPSLLLIGLRGSYGYLKFMRACTTLRIINNLQLLTLRLTAPTPTRDP